MSTDREFPADPTGPPWSVDVLADLHAGVYPPEVAARLRQRIGSDPEALAVLSALDSTVDDLSLLPPLRMPDRFALRLDAAIAAESQARSSARTSSGPAPVTPIRPVGFDQGAFTGRRPQQFTGQFPEQRFAGAAGGGATGGPGGSANGDSSPPGLPHNVVAIGAARSRRNRWIGGLVAAAAVVAIGTVVATSLDKDPVGSTAIAPQTSISTSQPSTRSSSDDGPPAGAGPSGGGANGGPAAPTGSEGPSVPHFTTTGAVPNALELTPGRFQEAYPQIRGKSSGPLANVQTFTACMAANHIVGSDVLGVTTVTFQARTASAIAVAVDPAHARIVVVGLSCGVNGAAAYLDAETVTR